MTLRVASRASSPWRAPVEWAVSSGVTARVTRAASSGSIWAMPFKSQAQRRKFAQLLVEGKISGDTFEEWNRETGARKLPERVARPKASKRAKTSTRKRSSTTARKRSTAKSSTKR